MTFNVVSLREYLPLGQRVEDWALDAWQDGAWREFAKGTAIGSRRLWRGDDVTTTRVRLRVTKAPVCPAISELALHREPPEARSRRSPLASFPAGRAPSRSRPRPRPPSPGRGASQRDVPWVPSGTVTRSHDTPASRSAFWKRGDCS